MYPVSSKFNSIDKTSPNIPVIVMQKPFEALKRLLVVHSDELMEDPDVVMTNLFNFVGLKQDHNYLKMSGLKKKFSVYPGKVKSLKEWKFVSGNNSKITIATNEKLISLVVAYFHAICCQILRK